MEQKVADWSPLWTERLLLRRPETSDESAAVHIHTDPLTNRHHPEPATVTAESATRRFSEMREHWERHGFGAWIAALRSEPAVPLGFTGLTHRTVHDRAVLNLYYRYTPSAWGRGYAKEAALTAVRHGQTFMPELPIVAYTTEDNVGSQRTALRVGLLRMPELDIDQGTHTDIYFALNW